MNLLEHSVHTNFFSPGKHREKNSRQEVKSSYCENKTQHKGKVQNPMKLGPKESEAQECIDTQREFKAHVAVSLAIF